MKVIIFDGTPEEFKTLFPQISTEATFSATLAAINTPDGSLHPSDKTPPQNRAKTKRPWLAVNAEMADGSVKRYKSICAAYRWYATAAGMDRLYRNPWTFAAALKSGAVTFADTTLSISAASRARMEATA